MNTPLNITSASPDQIAKAFFDYRKGVSDTRNDMNRDFVEKGISNMLQRRELWKYIAGVSLAVLGLSTFILERSAFLPYTITAIVLHSFIIFLIIMYLRELLDLEAREMKALQDKYNIMSDEVTDIVDIYIEKSAFTAEKWGEFWTEIKATPGAKNLLEENKILKEDQLRKDKELDYFGELIVFFLLTATFFMVLGSIGKILPLLLIISSILLIFALSFSDFVLKTSRSISRCIAFLKKERNNGAKK